MISLSASYYVQKGRRKDLAISLKKKEEEEEGEEGGEKPPSRSSAISAGVSDHLMIAQLGPEDL